jgi:predicted extracellular nuclease
MNSSKCFAILLIPIALFFLGSIESPKKQRTAGIVFYNVENLFDTLDNQSTNDNEFLPSAEKNWNSERYFKKLSMLGDVLSSTSRDLPVFIGLAEVENRKVIDDLVSTKKLTKAKYQIVHFDSPDDRGIDVCFLYAKKKVKTAEAKRIAVKTGENNTPSRDILLVRCELKRGPEIFFFVNHWPSRYGGQEETEPKRLRASQILGAQIDSILDLNPSAHIISMGDYNDYPDNKSLSDLLVGRRLDKLSNLMMEANSEYRGSYAYKGEWGYLDQFIVSKTLIDSIVPDINSSSTRSFAKEEMIHTTRSGRKVPNRTYGGPNYYGGYSDHLPIYTELVY